MATQQREQQYAGADRYATSLFYGSQSERHDSRSTFGATYSNGQARPITSIAPANRPVVRPVAPAPTQLSTLPINGGSLRDGVVFSLETREMYNGSSLDRFSSTPRGPQPAGRGDAKGPQYSQDFRSALDSLLGG